MEMLFQRHILLIYELKCGIKITITNFCSYHEEKKGGKKGGGKKGHHDEDEKGS